MMLRSCIALALGRASANWLLRLGRDPHTTNALEENSLTYQLSHTQEGFDGLMGWVKHPNFERILWMITLGGHCHLQRVLLDVVLCHWHYVME